MSTFSDVVLKHSNKVLDGVECYHLGFDIDDTGKPTWNIKELGSVLIDELVDFAFGEHKEKYAKENGYNEARMTGQSAGILYDPIKTSEKGKDGKYKFESKGEFGELILFSILKHYWKTEHLLAKLYFKDTDGMAVHGFDAVHLIEVEGKVKLCMGETKIYDTGKDGVTGLISDLKKHIKFDYLEKEFGIISRKFSLFEGQGLFKKETEQSVKKILSSGKLKSYCSSIVIPMLCTYQNESIYTKHSDEKTSGFITDLEKEIKDLGESFMKRKSKHPLNQHLEIVFMLFPIKSKKDLIHLLHDKICAAFKLK